MKAMFKKKINKKNIIIVGAGERGLYIAYAFAAEENLNVTIIDLDPVRLQAVQSSLNAVGIVGDALSPLVLEEAGIQNADICITCTNSDETNIVCALIAKQQYNIAQCIAVSSDGLRNRSILKRIKAQIDIVNTSAVTTIATLAVGRIPLATEASSFGNNTLLFIGYRVNEESPWVHKKIAEIREQAEGTQFIIACVIRDGAVMIPSGDNKLQPYDYVYIIFLREEMQMINDMLHVSIEPMQKAIVFGYGDTVNQFVSGLLRNHYNVTLICPHGEKLPAIQKYFSHRPRFKAVTGDASSMKLQLQKEVSRASLFVSAVPEDYVNIGTCIMAKFLGVKKTVAFVNTYNLFDAAQSEDIDGIISPRLLVAREVKKLVFKTPSTINYTTIGETNMEVRELLIPETSPVVDKCIKDLKLPKNYLIGAVIRKNVSLIPNGDTLIQALDTIVLFTLLEEVNKLSKVFGEVQEHK